MIILDTNIVSELMRADPHPKVRSWIAKQLQTQLYITSIVIAEIQRGIHCLPEGKKKQTLYSHFHQFVAQAFDQKILPFDEHAALDYGKIAAERQMSGFNTDAVDLMIAAIAKHHHAIIATRNTKDFKDCGVRLINPWQE